MAFRLGVLAAIVAYRRRNGKTRLKTLQQTLKNNKKSTVLYEYPTKQIFSIIFLITLIIGIEWLLFQIKSDVSEMNTQLAANSSTIFQSLEPIQFPLYSSNENQLQLQKRALHNKLQRISYFTKGLHLVLLVLIMNLIYHLELKVVAPAKQQNKISIITYALIKPTKSQFIQVEDSDKLMIREMGDSRITKTDYYYSVRLVGQKKNRHVIKKSCIFDARVALIKLAHYLQISFSTKIVKRSTHVEQIDQQF